VARRLWGGGAAGREEAGGGGGVGGGACGGGGVGRARAPPRRGNARHVFEAPQPERRCLADEGGQRHAAAHRHFVASELGAPENALELDHHGLQAAVGDEHVVAAADHHHGQVLVLGEGQGVAHVGEILRHHEERDWATA